MPSVRLITSVFSRRLPLTNTNVTFVLGRHLNTSKTTQDQCLPVDHNQEYQFMKPDQSHAQPIKKEQFSSTFHTKYQYDSRIIRRLNLQGVIIPLGRMFHTNSLCFAKEIEQDSDEILAKGDKVFKVRLATTRLDAILKTGLNISRNKIEKAFYEDRIRVNGERPKKKSQMVAEGDEVDIVRGINKLNPLFIDVSRVDLIEVGDSGGAGDDEDDESGTEDEGDKIPAVIKRYKLLTIQNYAVPWKGNISEYK